MGRYVTILRWKPEQAREIFRVSQSLTNGKAPKEIIAAAAKMKMISQSFCPSNNLSILTFEVDDNDFGEVSLVTLYLQGCCSMETYPVLDEATSRKTNQMYIKIFPQVIEERT